MKQDKNFKNPPTHASTERNKSKENNRNKQSLASFFFSVVNGNQCDSAATDDKVYLFFLKDLQLLDSPLLPKRLIWLSNAKG